VQGDIANKWSIKAVTTLRNQVVGVVLKHFQYGYDINDPHNSKHILYTCSGILHTSGF
jgi:hypothetical protein